jgi:hypothetical protein
MEVLRQIELATSALLHDGPRIVGLMLVLEGCEPSHDLANEDADAPDVGFVGVTDLHHYFRGTVSRSSTVSIRPVCFYIVDLLGKSKVNQLNVAFPIDQNVLRFEVSVDDAHAVQSFDPHHNFGYVKPRVSLVQVHVLSDLLVEFTPREVVQ